MIKDSKAYQYAIWCIAPGNDFVGRYIKIQAGLWVDIVDGRNPEAYFNEKAFKKIVKILKLMVHPDLGGKVTIFEGLEDWAWFLIVATFCTFRTQDDTRYYQTGLLEICRKNYKTFVAAIIFIIGLLTEPLFSRFFSVAPDYKLSSELRLAARKIIKSSPLIMNHFNVTRDMITCKLTESEYTPLAYSNDRMDGKLANIFLADEAGAMDDYPVEAMRSSQITLRDKLGLILSTQYPNDNNVMIDEIDYAKKILDGLVENKRYFALLYEPNEEIVKEWEKNDLVIYQSNPVAYSTPMVFDAIKEKRVLAVEYENKRENYLCKHNNIKYQGLGTEGFIGIDKVKQCRIEKNKAFWKGKKVYLGLDLSLTDDNTSATMITDESGIVYANSMGFLPADRVELKTNKERVDYKKLIREGNCRTCGDEVIDYAEIEAYVAGIEKEYGVEVMQVGYDRWNALSTAQKLEAKGLEMVEVKMHSSVLHPATKFLYESILNKTFRYEDNRLLEINFQNARCTYDTNMNKYVNKKKSAGKVDMVISLIIAMYLYQQEQLNSKDISIMVL